MKKVFRSFLKTRKVANGDQHHSPASIARFDDVNNSVAESDKQFQL